MNQHRLVIRYWNHKKEQYAHLGITGTMEDLEEYLTHSEVTIDKATIDGQSIELN